MTTQLRIAWIVGVLAAAVLLRVTLDSAASRYLRRFEDHRLMNVALDRERAANYRRPIVIGTPISENAAAKYRTVFANLETLPKDTSRQVGALVNQGITVDVATARSFLADQCGEVQSREFRDGLRCTQCDWQLSSAFHGPGLDALFLGNCLVLSGHSSGGSRDWRRSAQSCVEALAFACDLGQADFSANLVGLAVATSALRGLSDLLRSAGHDAAFLRYVSQLLSSNLTERLPSMTAGIRSRRAELATHLMAEAQVTAGTLNRVGVVVPGTAFAAWRLRQHESVLDKLEQAAAGGDAEQRVALAREVREYANASGSQAFKRVPTIIPEAILDAESVALQYGLVRAQIFIHEWRLQHGSFPTDVAQLRPFLRKSTLQYEPIDRGKGYRIVVARGYRAGEVLITHSPGTSQ